MSKGISNFQIENTIKNNGDDDLMITSLVFFH